jgi:hypothetical protein
MLDNATRSDYQADDANYLVVLTTAARGSIPPNIWRRAFVIYL